MQLYRLALFGLGLLASHPTTAFPVDQEVLKPLHLWHSQTKDVYDVRRALQESEIIPTVIPDFMPTSTLSVDWAPGVSASLGNTISTLLLQLAPSLTLTHAPSALAGAADTPLTSCLHVRNMTYVMTLTDPDAPSRADPSWAEVAHWIAAGVPASTSSETGAGCARLDFGPAATTTGGLRDVLAYKPPAPPEGTGPHRYVFMVFAPANGTTERLNLSPPSERRRWGAARDGSRGSWNWAQGNGLVPVAANFIYAEHL